MRENEHPVPPPSLSAGRIEGIPVPDLLWKLCLRRHTGVLHLARDGIYKTLYLDDGNIVFAASSSPDDRIGERLLRDGRITLPDLEAAIAQLGSGKRIGTILAEAGSLDPEGLVQGVLDQVRGIVLDLFEWTDGEYSFDEGPLPTEEVITLGMKTAEILLQGIRHVRSFSAIRKSVGSPRTSYRLTVDWDQRLEGIAISEGERLLLRRIGTSGASIEELCEEDFLSNFETHQALWAFRVIGAVEPIQTETPVGEVAVAGDLQQTSLPEVLIHLGREGQTGLLHVFRGAVERTLHIRDGICTFATSSELDDGLVAHLLRRGVISLRDREESAKLRLSNKRVGTILLEMGVLDEADLRETVREHLSEIVYDTCTWDRGEFSFVAGELPTIEEITLDASVERLVADSLGRITSWTRVLEGCGGPGRVLMLTPDYLTILDRIDVGQEEWEVVSKLRDPSTVEEICTRTDLRDFRVCQILWALKMLGAIVDEPEPAAPWVPETPPRAEEIAPAEAPEPVLATVEVAPSPEPEPAADVAPAPRTGPIESLFEPEPEPEPELAVEAAPAPEPEPEREPDAEEVAEEIAEIEVLDTPEPLTRESSWAAPPGLDEAIESFNARHRLVFRHIRSEIGAGAVNFVRSCRNGAIDESELFADIELQPDGTFDPEVLRKAVIDLQIPEPSLAFQKLLEQEVELLRMHIGELRTHHLRQQLRRLA